jgi:polysaccharide export outer membrane protein
MIPNKNAHRMQPRIYSFGFMLFAAMLAGPVLGQSSAPTQTSPTLQQHPEDALKALEPTGHEEYEVAGGDELAVTVAGRPELSGPQLVGPDGRITLPVVGSIDVGGLTRDAAAAAISKATSAYYTDVSVTVQVNRYGSNHILLLGNVTHPGLLTFDQPPTLLEAITRGGAVAGGTDDKTSRFPSRCIIYRGSNQVVSVDLDDLLEAGKAFSDIRLRRNDVVFIPADQDRVVSVIGEVRNPGAITLTHSSTLIKLIAETGGLSPTAGSPTIMIVHPATGKTQYIAFKELLKPNGGTDISLNNGDIVFVPKSGLAKTGYFLQQIAPLASLATVATFATR